MKYYREILLLIIILVIVLCGYFFKTNKHIEWVKVEETAVEQYKIYLKSETGHYVNGVVEITTIAGDTFEEEISKQGSKNVYIKSVIKEVKVKE